MVLALAGALGAPAERATAAPPDPPASLLVQPFADPVPLPAVALTDLEGRTLGAAELRGKLVLLNFWATWCVPCRAEMPALDVLYRANRERGFVVLAVNFKESAPDVRRFVQAANVSFPIALDLDGSASGALGVRGLPVSFLLDAEGKLLWKAIGSRAWAGPDAQVYLDRLLPRPRP